MQFCNVKHAWINPTLNPSTIFNQQCLMACVGVNGGEIAVNKTSFKRDIGEGCRGRLWLQRNCAIQPNSCVTLQQNYICETCWPDRTTDNTQDLELPTDSALCCCCFYFFIKSKTWRSCGTGDTTGAPPPLCSWPSTSVRVGTFPTTKRHREWK